MKIHKDTHPGFDSKAKIQAEIDKAATEWQRRCNGENFPFTARSWAFEIVKTGESWEYIAKNKAVTDQEEADKARLEAEKQAETDKKALFAKAKSDPETRDQLIFSEMNKAGFSPEKIILWKIAEEKDGKDMSTNWTARAAAKQKIVDEINAAV